MFFRYLIILVFAFAFSLADSIGKYDLAAQKSQTRDISNYHKILNISVLKNTLRIKFDKKADLITMIPNHLGTKDYYDIRARLMVRNNTYNVVNIPINIGQNRAGVTRIVVPVNKNSYEVKYEDNVMIIEITPKDSVNTLKNNQNSIREIANNSVTRVIEGVLKPQEIANAQNNILSSTARQLQNLKPKKIMIDPGHGGHDCGALGVNSVCEKTIVLTVGKLLAAELKNRGYIVYMTRNSDKYVNLKNRTQLANDKEADLFISIHANSISKNSPNVNEVHGVETYFLSTARSNRARDVAELENKDDIDIMNYFSKTSFLNSLNSYRLISSNRLAIDVQYGILQSVKKQYKTFDGGVREGPFWVLAGALMPSVLVELGYNSHPQEAKMLINKDYQRSLAIGIANGIEGYFLKNN